VQLIHSPEIEMVRKNELVGLFPLADIKLINWMSEKETYHRAIRLIMLPELRFRCLLGITSSIGNLTESSVKQASSSFLSLIRTMDTDTHEALKSSISHLMEYANSNNRLVLPTLNLLDTLLSSTVLVPYSRQFLNNLLQFVKGQMSVGTPIKLILISDVLCQIIQVEIPEEQGAGDHAGIDEIHYRALFMLSTLLGQKFPRVRQATAQKFYEALITVTCNADDEDKQPIRGLEREALQDAMAMLSETQWDVLAMDEAREVRNRVCSLIGVAPPKLIKSK